METINIEAKPTASRRTKNRLKEHKILFFVDTAADLCLSNVKGEAVLLKCGCGHEWFGWLPLTEITIK